MRNINLLNADIRYCDDVLLTDDAELEFAWQCWFDVDLYFGVNTKNDDEKWIDFMTYWNKATDDITAIYVIDTKDGFEQHDWKLTDEEKAFLRKKMEAYIRKSFVDYYNECNEDTFPSEQLSKNKECYPANKDVCYIISMSEISSESGVYYSICCNEAVVDGKKKILHNEIGCSLEYENNHIKVLSGWHIGTEDFSWEDEGNDWVLEKYHPGISRQIVDMIESRKGGL